MKFRPSGCGWVVIHGDVGVGCCPPRRGGWVVEHRRVGGLLSTGTLGWVVVHREVGNGLLSMRS